MPASLSPVVEAPRTLFDGARGSAGTRTVPEETPVAFTYDRAAYAVMMASPSDFEDFALGFSLTEGIIEQACDILETEIVALPKGVELRMSLARSRKEHLETRRRRFAGPAGCGLCGIESLDAATSAARKVPSAFRTDVPTIFAAVNALRDEQHLNAQTRAVHAAGFWSAKKNGFVAVREDVGRHNALDKLAGALMRAGEDARDGLVVLTSRVSIELVQKTAAIGAPMLVAVSAPTAYAIREADAAGLTVIGIARKDSFEVFTHPERIVS